MNSRSLKLPRKRLILASLALLALSGCASLSPDGGFGPVEQVAKDRLGKQVTWARSDADRDAIDKRVAQLLEQPLSADDAVQVALLNNRGLQASFAELGVSEADMVQAGRLPNPGFSFGRLTQGSSVEIDRGIQFNLARLLMLPMVNQIEARRFEQARGAVALSMLSLASETRKAYVLAVAADETKRYMLQVQTAAEAGAELARRQAQAGNWNKLQQAREQSFYADAALNLARAEQARGAARERLTRLMGLWGSQTQFRLPERLPDLPKAPNDLPDIEQTAMAQRLDVQAARLGTEQLAKNLGLTRATRFVNVLEVGAVRNSYNDAPTQRGYTISVELPLFDWGGARVAKAEAIYMQAVNRAAETAINARSEVRGAYANYRTSYDIARHVRDEIVPLKKRISEENQLRYNGMLIGVFELLADARSQITSVNGYIEALRDFWLAQADLDMALIGTPSMTALPAAMSTTDSGAAAH
ncbi:TolC family protein [Methylibium sp.]|uniref:TolC family protein n=1 Tax=Methylibium sp. TaxID=2067992 RepID=UPI003D121B57